MSALTIFKDLTSVPTAPFFEDAVAARAKSWVRRTLGRRVGLKRRKGGLIIHYRGGEGDALVLAAHLDHPAFHLRRVTRHGAIARVLGGLKKEILPGASIEAFPRVPKDNRPLARGVLGKGAGDLFPVRWTAPLPYRARPRFATLDLVPCKREGPWLLSRSIDDLLGCAVSLEALRRIVVSKARTNLTVILTFAEEVGCIGAMELIRAGDINPRDSIISVETSKWLPGALQGKGPVIRTGDKSSLFDPNLIRLLDESAQSLKRRGMKSQRLRLTGGTCEGTVFTAFGYETAGLAVPLDNYHNTGPKGPAPEKVRFSDVEPSVRLLVEAARRFPKARLRGFLRGRLAERSRKIRRYL